MPAFIRPLRPVIICAPSPSLVYAAHRLRSHSCIASDASTKPMYAMTRSKCSTSSMGIACISITLKKRNNEKRPVGRESRSVPTEHTRNAIWNTTSRERHDCNPRLGVQEQMDSHPTQRRTPPLKVAPRVTYIAS
ncbi:hypothetical protein JB92DRAFT_1524084 [Gautieria morchelliformis]|nr:hypothetical protein JB92DRAFT_1524084 [Gautieria morchelliformis]